MQEREPRTMWKAHISSDGIKWGESIWISVDQNTGSMLESDDEFEFIGEVRNDPITVPEMKFGHKYMFRADKDNIYSVTPIKEIK